MFSKWVVILDSWLGFEFYRLNSSLSWTLSQWIYRWICDIEIIWKLSYVNLQRRIVWTLNCVDCISFFVFFPYGSQSSQMIKNFILKFLKNIKTLSLQKGSYKIRPVHQTIHLSVCLPACLPACNTFFSGSTQWIFLIFCMRIFCHIY